MADRGTDLSDRPDHGYGTVHRRSGPLRDWRLKAVVQTALGWLPRGQELNFLLQRHITRTLPISDPELAGQVAKARRNIEAYRRLGPTPLDEAHLYEFGVGWDLLMPLAYHAMGADRQTVIDLSPLARVDLVRNAARRVAEAAPVLGLPRAPQLPKGERSVHELAAACGIDYRAPADARAVELRDGSVDMVTSCDVLEHVPLGDIGAILRESRRILRDDGLFRIRIDYQDHYWYFDSRLSPYNFLRFDERAWRRFNPSLHYQNRLRHDGFIDLVTRSGWTIIEDEPHTPTIEDLEAIGSLRLAKPFGAAPLERLAIRYANMTLAKATFGERH